LKERQDEVLRIDSLNENELTTLRVEGKLMGPWVRELERCWEKVVAERPPRLVRVNLSAVGFIDSQGKQLLCRMRKQGSVLVPNGCFMKSIVDEIEREASKE
jgi:anti-anti-sigma regulatory factor